MLKIFPNVICTTACVSADNMLGCVIPLNYFMKVTPSHYLKDFEFKGVGLVVFFVQGGDPPNFEFPLCAKNQDFFIMLHT